MALPGDHPDAGEAAPIVVRLRRTVPF